MKRTVLVIQAHPDDAEFRVSGTVAKFARAGDDVYYITITDGSKGTFDPSSDPIALAKAREAEQRRAAEVLGVRGVFFMGYPDGELMPSLELRGQLVTHIRRLRPNIVMALDPWLPYNVHPDHRTAGIMAAEATAFAGMPSFHRGDLNEGLREHQPEHIYLFRTNDPNEWVDISDTIDAKVRAILCHRSQLSLLPQLAGKQVDMRELEADVDREVRKRAVEIGSRCGKTYAEAFKVLEVEAGHFRIELY
jgi:LmbE family N-acetylglucosaminyl deacetylase